MIIENIFNNIVCPICKKEVREKKHVTDNGVIIENAVVCSSCERVYPINEGIINMLPDELRFKDKIKESKNWGEWRKRLEMFRVRMKTWQKEDTTKNIPVYKELFEKFCSVSGRVLEIGCADGIVRHFIDKEAQYWGIDPDSDWISRTFHPWKYDIIPCLKEKFPFIQAVGEYLPFRDEFFDNAIIAAALDHVNSPGQVLGEVYRVLKHGAQVVILVGVGKSQKQNGRIASSVKRGLDRISKGQYKEAAESIYHRFFMRPSPDLTFSDEDIVNLLSRFSSLEKRDYDEQLKFFKAIK